MPGYEPVDKRRSCMLPWILLVVVLITLAASVIWGYTRRQEVAQYAVAAMLEQQLGTLLPPDEDPVKVATRIAGVVKAVKDGKLDPEALKGMGAMFRQYYEDRKLDPQEFESLLSYAEAAVTK